MGRSVVVGGEIESKTKEPRLEGVVGVALRTSTTRATPNEARLAGAEVQAVTRVIYVRLLSIVPVKPQLDLHQQPACSPGHKC